jgi:hypothetical protein
MKRFVIATASALFLIAGNAFASVPGGATPGSGAGSPSSATALGASGTTAAPAATAASAPLASGVLTGIFADPDLGLPGLPGGASQLLGSVDPVLSGVTGAVPAPVAGLVPPVAGLVPAPLAGPIAPPAAAPPAPVPGVTPPPSSPPSSPPSGSATAPPAKRHASVSARRVSPKAVQAAAAAALFQGLPPTGYAGYGTASVIHTDLLQVGTQRLENLDAAFSGAAFSSAPLAQPTTNEMARIVAPALAAGNAYGRGSGLEVGVAIDQSGQNQIIPGSVAEAKAPPSTGLITKEVGPVAVNPLASADLLRGQAQGVANAACTTGVDLSYGLGYAANLGLIDGGLGSPTLSTSAATPDRSVSQSRSHTFLVPQANASTPIRKFGLASETRETIAPITFFKGQASQFTLEFAGEWVLRTTSDGNTGTVFYGPGSVTPDTPLLRVLDKNGNLMSNIPEITTQTLFGPTGLNVSIPNVATITIGGPPRMIGGSVDSKPVQTGTLTAAAVDVVSVQLLDTSGAHVADVRIGHMENATAVPAGGITCGIGLVKTSDHDTVTPGQDFNWTVTVSNPNDCVLQQLKVVDTITADPNVVWTVQDSTPNADQMAKTGLTWNDVGPLNPGQSKALMIHVLVLPNSGAGKFLDTAEATGVCGPAAGTAGANAAVGVPLEAKVSLNLPQVIAALGALLPRELPRTGGALAVLPALALTGGGLALRRSSRRKKRQAR